MVQLTVKNLQLINRSFSASESGTPANPTSEQKIGTGPLRLSAGAFRCSPIPSAIVSLEKGLVDANDQFWHTFGSRAEQMIEDLLQEQSAPPLSSQTKPMNQLWEEGAVNQFQVEVVGASGASRIVLVSGAVVTDQPELLAVLHFMTFSRSPEGSIVLLLEGERQHMVQTIHDDLQQTLFALRLQLQAARKSTDATVHSTLDEAEDYLREIMHTARDLRRELASLPAVKEPKR